VIKIEESLRCFDATFLWHLVKHQHACSKHQQIRLSELYHDLMPCCPLAQLAATEAFDQVFHYLPLAMTKQTDK
jgi:hypothetical protein